MVRFERGAVVADVHVSGGERPGGRLARLIAVLVASSVAISVTIAVSVWFWGGLLLLLLLLELLEFV